MTLAAAVVDEVRRRLTARGMSQTSLARAAQLPPTIVHRTMNRDRDLTVDEFEAFASALAVTPVYLLRKSIDNAAPPIG